MDVQSLGRVGALGGIDAVYLPVDGECRIEARSFLDDTAVGYALTLESRRVEVDPAILQSYAGRYEDPWGDLYTVSFEDGRLYLLSWPEEHVLDPISETVFIANPDVWRVVFRKGDDGLVTGFELVAQRFRLETVRLED